MEDSYYLDKNAVNNICTAIVLSAIKDWKALCKKEAKLIKKGFSRADDVRIDKDSFDTIKAFLKSDYGESVCLTAGIHPDKVAKKLDEYRDISIKNARKERCKR